SQQVAASLGIGIGGVKWLLFAQIFVGAILVLFMDEVISKWGVGSGIGLFIIAGVSQSLIGGFFGGDGFFSSWLDIITGAIEVSPLTSEGLQTLLFGQGDLIALFTTLLIF